MSQPAARNEPFVRAYQATRTNTTVTPLEAFMRTLAYMQAEHKRQEIKRVEPPREYDEEFEGLFDRYFEFTFPHLVKRYHIRDWDELNIAYSVAVNRWEGGKPWVVTMARQFLAEPELNHAQLFELLSKDEIKGLLDTEPDDSPFKEQIRAQWTARAEPNEVEEIATQERAVAEAAELARIAALPPPPPPFPLSEQTMRAGYNAAVAFINENSRPLIGLDIPRNAVWNAEWAALKGLHKTYKPGALRTITHAMSPGTPVEQLERVHSLGNNLLELALELIPAVWVSGMRIAGYPPNPYDAIYDFLASIDAIDEAEVNLFLIHAMPARVLRQYEQDHSDSLLARLLQQERSRAVMEQTRMPHHMGSTVATLVARSLAPDTVDFTRRPLRNHATSAQQMRDEPYLTNEVRLDMLIADIDDHTDPKELKRKLQQLSSSIKRSKFNPPSEDEDPPSGSMGRLSLRRA